VRSDFEIGGHKVPAGTRALVDLHVSKLSNHTPITLPVHVLHGPRPGPTMFISAAIHGDELNGVEIIRRVLRTLQPGNLAGTLLAIPVVNAYGFIGRSRYLPDRRDLNRSFPGSGTGSHEPRPAPSRSPARRSRWMARTATCTRGRTPVRTRRRAGRFRSHR
jgi:predicted deacylase